MVVSLCVCFFVFFKGGGQKGDFLSSFFLPIENKWDLKVWLGGEGGWRRGRRRL